MTDQVDQDAASSPPPDPDAPFLGQARRRGFDRVSHGLFMTTKDLPTREAVRRELGAWLLVLPDGARFTHLTGAMLRGWDLPKLPENLPIFVAVTGDGARPRRQGLVCSRLVTTSRGDEVDGLPVEDPEEILLRAARDLGQLDLRILVEGAMRAGDLDNSRMEKLLASRRPGVRNLRAVHHAACDETQSAGETMLLAFHEVMEIPVEPQKRLFSPDGDLVAQADLYVTGTDWFHEYDGEVHRGKKQHATDLRRDRGVAGSTYVRKGFVMDDLVNHALVVMHELDRALDRPHTMQRFRRWSTLVQQSLYSETGRERLINRWHRQMGVLEWSKTA